MRNISVIGCGLMGRGLVKNLLNAGYETAVFDLNKDAVNSLADIGARPCDSAEEAARRSDVIILSLPSPKAIYSLVETNILGNLKAGGKIIDMSTNDVELTKELSRKAKDQGIDFFDCPLSGGPQGAEDGTLTIMAGGDKEAFPEIMPVLEAVGKNIEYTGESGSGQIVKLCHNLLVGGIIGLLSEVLLTGEKAGLNKERIASIFQKGTGQTRVMDVFGVNIINESVDDVKFSLANMEKDMSLYSNLAEAYNVPDNLSKPVLELFQQATEKGMGRKDASAVYELLREMMGKVKSD